MVFSCVGQKFFNRSFITLKFEAERERERVESREIDR